jgi:hypothetical protein
MACNDTASAAELSCLSTYFGNILTAMVPLIGLLAFVMLLIGGFKILTSAGDAKGVAGGKQTITLAVAGIALAIISWIILLIVENVTGAKVTEFKFGF